MASLANTTDGSAVFIATDKGDGEEQNQREREQREQREREQREREQREREQREREQREREQREREQREREQREREREKREREIEGGGGGEEKETDDFYYLPPLKEFREDPSRPSTINSRYDTGERMSILNTRRETMLEIMADLNPERDPGKKYHPKDGKTPPNLDDFVTSYEAYSYEEIRKMFDEMVCKSDRISEHPPHHGQAWFVWFIFKIFDEDRDGYLSYREMHELLTVGNPDIFAMYRGPDGPLSDWAFSEIQAKKEKKAGDRRFFISKDHWEKLAAHFGVPPMPGLPVDAVATFLGHGWGEVCVTGTKLKNSHNNAWVEASPEHAPAKDEASSRSVAFTVEQWNAMFPNHAIDVEAQKKMLSQTDLRPDNKLTHRVGSDATRENPSYLTSEDIKTFTFLGTATMNDNNATPAAARPTRRKRSNSK